MVKARNDATLLQAVVEKAADGVIMSDAKGSINKRYRKPQRTKLIREMIDTKPRVFGNS